MKGKTLAIMMLVITIVAVAVIYFLVMATFKKDTQNEEAAVQQVLLVPMPDHSIES